MRAPHIPERTCHTSMAVCVARFIEDDALKLALAFARVDRSQAAADLLNV